MSHVALVAVVDTLHYLTPKEFSFQLWHLSIGLHLEVTMQRATVDILHEKEDLLMRLKSFIQLTDVRMV